MSKDKKRALAILFAFGFLTELLVAQTNLWTYSSQLVRVGCVIGLYLFVIGGITLTFWERPNMVRYLVGVGAFIIIELANAYALHLWSFEGSPVFGQFSPLTNSVLIGLLAGFLPAAAPRVSVIVGEMKRPLVP
ncbi:MAG: hypothetical protein H6684_10195 [Deltaproteobacteria bacterium]|nr:hypothetical protein [bacterium]MCB9489088.1 hypothetical protein [Deltaproteobacteria bacterium]